MINILSRCSASFFLVNAWVIIVEIISHLETHRDWSDVVKSFGQFDFIALSDVVASESYIADSDSWSVVAFSVLSCVRISHWCFKTSSISDVFKSMRWKTSIATFIVEVPCTIDQLLFWKQYVSSLSEDVPMWLHGADSWEGPTWTTFSLVFNWSNHSLIFPIVVWRNLSILVLNLKPMSGRTVLRLHQLFLLKFFKSHVAEIVDSLGPRFACLVVLNYIFKFGREKTESVFRFRVVFSAKLLINLSGDKLCQFLISVQNMTILNI